MRRKINPTALVIARATALFVGLTGNVMRGVLCGFALVGNKLKI